MFSEAFWVTAAPAVAPAASPPLLVIVPLFDSTPLTWMRKSSVLRVTPELTVRFAAKIDRVAV